jgi:hypothetical protein
MAESSVDVKECLLVASMDFQLVALLVDCLVLNSAYLLEKQ